MYRLLVIAACMLAAGACEQATVGPNTPAGPSAATVVSGTWSTGSAGAASTSSMAGERPWKAQLAWIVTGMTWADPANPMATSLFGGRCTVPSNYVIDGSFKGEATHAGRVTGTTSHCSQLIFGPEGPVGAAYTDGQLALTSANGSTITGRYSNGMSGYDVQAGENWFEDTWTFTDGTGLFAGVTGSGQEGGRFKDFGELLGGVPAAMWMEGTITYNPSGK